MKSLFSILVLSAALLCNSSAGENRTNSLYELPINLVDQDGRTVALNAYRGHPVVVTLFYSTCPNTCPLLMESLRVTENALTPKVRDELRVFMVSIDPARDTPKVLSELARTRHVDTRRWTLARANEDDVRLLAAALGVQFRKLPNGEYNHTSTLTLLSREGVIDRQTAMLGKTDPDFLAALERNK